MHMNMYVNKWIYVSINGYKSIFCFTYTTISLVAFGWFLCKRHFHGTLELHGGVYIAS